MTGRHRIAACCLALALAACRQTVVFNRADGSLPADLAAYCLDGDRDVLQYTQRPPNVIVALDRSASMNAPFGAVTEIRAALATLDDVSARYQTSVRFGFVEFPGVVSTAYCSDDYRCCAGKVTPPFSDYQAFQFAAHNCDQPSFSCTTTSEERPTTEALRACFNAYSESGPLKGNRYVLLVTDGAPTCGGSGCSAAQMITNLRGANVMTFVVVLGNVTNDDCLSTMALSGGADIGMSPFYHSAISPETLNIAVSKIVGTIAEDACRLELRDPAADPDQVSLFLDSDRIVKGGPNGWDFADKDRKWITLQGAACERLHAAPAGALDVYRCSERR